MRLLRVGEKWLDSGDIFNVEPVGSAEGFSIGYERKKRKRDRENTSMFLA